MGSHSATGISACGHDGDFFSAVLVAHAELDGFHSVQNVKLHDGEAGETVDLNGAAQGGAVKPAATTRTPRNGAELTALFTEHLAHFVVKFGRERTFADAGAIGLGDAEHVVEHVRTDAGACTAEPATVLELVTYG